MPVRKKKKYILECITGYHRKYTSRKEIILLEDLNAREGKRLGNNVIRRLGEEFCNGIEIRLIKICEQCYP